MIIAWSARLKGHIRSRGQLGTPLRFAEQERRTTPGISDETAYTKTDHAAALKKFKDYFIAQRAQGIAA
jgi:hypothetical protein